MIAINPMLSLVFVVLFGANYSLDTYSSTSIVPPPMSPRESAQKSVQCPGSVVEDTVTPPLIGSSVGYGVDSSVSPCEDFFAYANGGWRAKTVLGLPTPGRARVVSMFDDTNRRTQKRLRTIIDSAHTVASTTTDHVLKVIGTFFESCVAADSVPPPGVGVPPRASASPNRSRDQKSTDEQKVELCYRKTLGSLGVAVGQAFARDLLVFHALERMEALLTEIHLATIERMKVNPWMSRDERTAAAERLNRLKLRIGMPQELIDFSSLELSNDFTKNEAAVVAFSNRQWLSSIGEDARERWRASLVNTNASYSAADHAIEVPAAMFMPPFFVATADDAVNFAGIGVVIAHEIFHSLTSQLRSTANPKMHDNIQLFKAVNSQLGTLDGWGTDGTRTYTEDIADLGGILVAYDAWQAMLRKKNTKPPTIDGYTPDQRFFLAVAQVWRGKWTGIGFSGVHAAPFARTHNMIRNAPQFAAAFECKEGDPMVVPRDQRPVIW